MISEELRKYIDMVNEEWEQDQLFEMANIDPKTHGIENIYIYVGRAPKTHGLRVKVSNIPNKMRMEDSFTIMMPSLDYDPKQVANWVKPKMPDILAWIKLNQKLLYDYEEGRMDNTTEFLSSISKV